MRPTPDRRGKRGRISRSRRAGATILRPVGALDGVLADEIIEASLAAHGPVVVDLGEAVLIDAASLRRIVLGWQLHRPPMCIVSHRPAAWSLLQHAEVDQHVPVFHCVEGALADDGWRFRRRLAVVRDAPVR